MAGRKEDQDVKVVENRRPSQNYVKKPRKAGLTEVRVTPEKLTELRDAGKVFGYFPHLVNNVVPVDAQTNEIKPAPDGTIGTALLKEALPTERKKVEEPVKEEVAPKKDKWVPAVKSAPGKKERKENE